MNSDSTRLRRFNLGMRLAADLLSGRLRLTNLPEGAKVRHVGWDLACLSFSLIVEHESFAEVPDGAEIPIHLSEIAPIESAEPIKFREFT